MGIFARTIFSYRHPYSQRNLMKININMKQELSLFVNTNCWILWHPWNAWHPWNLWILWLPWNPWFLEVTVYIVYNMHICICIIYAYTYVWVDSESQGFQPLLSTTFYFFCLALFQINIKSEFLRKFEIEKQLIAVNSENRARVPTISRWRRCPIELKILFSTILIGPHNI